MRVQPARPAPVLGRHRRAAADRRRRGCAQARLVRRPDVVDPQRPDARVRRRVAKVEHRAPDETRRTYLAPRVLYGQFVISRGAMSWDVDPARKRVVVSENKAAVDPVAGRRRYRAARRQLPRGAHGEQQRRRTAGRTWSTSSAATPASARCGCGSTCETHVVLAKEAYHSDGSLAWSTRFDDIRYTEGIPGASFAVGRPGRLHDGQGPLVPAAEQALPSAVPDAGFKPVTPKYLPEGFALVGADVAQIKGVRNLHLIYSDGIRNLSLFESSTDRAIDFTGMKSAGHAVRRPRRAVRPRRPDDAARLARARPGVRARRRPRPQRAAPDRDLGRPVPAALAARWLARDGRTSHSPSLTVKKSSCSHRGRARRRLRDVRVPARRPVCKGAARPRTQHGARVHVTLQEIRPRPEEGARATTRLDPYLARGPVSTFPRCRAQHPISSQGGGLRRRRVSRRPELDGRRGRDDRRRRRRARATWGAFMPGSRPRRGVDGGPWPCESRRARARSGAHHGGPATCRSWSKASTPTIGARAGRSANMRRAGGADDADPRRMAPSSPRRDDKLVNELRSGTEAWTCARPATTRSWHSSEIPRGSVRRTPPAASRAGDAQLEWSVVTHATGRS